MQVNQVGKVNGRLLRWARDQLGLSARAVQARGGPSPAYQCEVEKGLKAEVSQDVLSSWVVALNVTEAFARGELDVYARDPTSCEGLAASVRHRIVAQAHPQMSMLERYRLALTYMADHAQRVPRLVLAHVLGVELQTLEGMILGHVRMSAMILKAIRDLTTLPDIFFATGRMPGSVRDALLDYLPVLERLHEAGISAEEFAQLAQAWINREHQAAANSQGFCLPADPRNAPGRVRALGLGRNQIRRQDGAG